MRGVEAPASTAITNYRVASLELSPLLALMRFLGWRLKPKAAAAPRAGRGPGTGADTGANWAQVTTLSFGIYAET